MSRHPSRAARAGVVVLALAAAGALPFVHAAHAWPLGGGDVMLDNFTAKTTNGGALVVAHAEFVNTNLTKDEIERLLTPTTPGADERELLAKLKADQISIPSIAIDSLDSDQDSVKARLSDFVATGVDGGKIASLSVGGFEASGKDKDGPISMKAGALKVDGIDASAALSVTTAPEEALQKARVGALTWSGLDFVGPDASETPPKPLHLSIGSIENPRRLRRRRLQAGLDQSDRTGVQAGAGFERRQEPREPRLCEGRAVGVFRRDLQGRRQEAVARRIDHRGRRRWARSA